MDETSPWSPDAEFVVGAKAKLEFVIDEFDKGNFRHHKEKEVFE